VKNEHAPSFRDLFTIRSAAAVSFSVQQKATHEDRRLDACFELSVGTQDGDDETALKALKLLYALH